MKKTLNLREGDFEKLEQLLPDLKPGVAVRQVVSTFVDKHYKKEPVEE